MAVRCARNLSMEAKTIISGDEYVQECQCSSLTAKVELSRSGFYKNVSAQILYSFLYEIPVVSSCNAKFLFAPTNPAFCSTFKT